MNYAATHALRNTETDVLETLTLDYANLLSIKSVEEFEHPSQATDPHEFCEIDALINDHPYQSVGNLENLSCLFDKQAEARPSAYIPDLLDYMDSEPAQASFEFLDQPYELMMLLTEHYDSL